MKTIIGAYLIDAPFSALNNRGIDTRAANENEVATKTISSPEAPVLTSRPRHYVTGGVRFSKKVQLELLSSREGREQPGNNRS